MNLCDYIKNNGILYGMILTNIENYRLVKIFNIRKVKPFASYEFDIWAIIEDTYLTLKLINYDANNNYALPSINKRNWQSPPIRSSQIMGDMYFFERSLNKKGREINIWRVE